MNPGFNIPLQTNGFCYDVAHSIPKIQRSHAMPCQTSCGIARTKACLATALVTLLALVVSSCSNPPPAIPRDMNFKRYQPIMMNVGRISFLEDYQSPRHPPYVEHLLPITPAEAMKKWVDDRLRVAGTNKFMQVIVKDASVISTPIPDSGLSLGKSRRYDAKLSVEMRIYGEGAMSEASIQTTATRSITIPESASLRDRENAFRRMIFELMETMNAALEQYMFQYFGDYIVY